MDGLTVKVYNGVKCYWQTRGYHRLTPTIHRGKAGHEQERRRRRVWRIRLNRRLKLKLPRSPKQLFVGLRDVYVSMMMKLANTSVIRGKTVTGSNGDGFGKAMVKEYDEKIIIEICKNLAVRGDPQHQISSQIACSG